MTRFLLIFLAVLGISAAYAQEPQILQPEDAYNQVSEGQLTLIDIRRPEEWEATGIPKGAKAMTMHGPGGMDGLIEDITKLMDGDKSKPVAVICRSGGRSARMAAALSEAGFTNVYDVSEGMEGNLVKQGWAKRGLPVEQP